MLGIANEIVRKHLSTASQTIGRRFENCVKVRETRGFDGGRRYIEVALAINLVFNAMNETLKTDCRHFRGDCPCSFNKQFGTECSACGEYDRFQGRILFIKLGEMGDVVRSGSLLPAIVRKHPGSVISWLTSPECRELVSANPFVDEILLCDTIGHARIAATQWDYVYSLSNDFPSASFATIAAARIGTFGYTVGANGSLCPSNNSAQYWLEMASFDRVKKENARSWQSIMYEIAGCEEPIHHPPLRLDSLSQSNAVGALENISGEFLVGVNVGCGKRWPKKMLTANRIVDLCNRLTSARSDLTVALLGGTAEAQLIFDISHKLEANTRIICPSTCGSPLDLAAIIEQCDVLVCGDTLALHLATAVKTRTIALFGPTSAAEIYEYEGLIAKISTSELDCLGCYGDCNRNANCMSLIDLDQIVQKVLQSFQKDSRLALY